MKFKPLSMMIGLAVVTACFSGRLSPPEIAAITSAPVLAISPTSTLPAPTNTSAPPPEQPALTPELIATPTAPPLPAPVQNPPTSQCRVSADLLKLCTASSSNLRSIWTSPYEHLLTRGVVFSPLARNPDGAWLQVQIPKTNQAGWVPAGSQLMDCGNLNVAALPVAATLPDVTCSPTPTAAIGVVASLSAIEPGSKDVTLQIERADPNQTFFVTLLRLEITDNNGKRYTFDPDIPGNQGFTQLSSTSLPYQAKGVLKQPIDPTAAQVTLSLQIDRTEVGIPYVLIWQQALTPLALATPVPVVTQPEGPVDSVFVSMPYLFLGQGANLVILDPALNPAQPVVIGAAALSPETKISAMATLGYYDHYTYVMADGLRIFDISNPTQPVQVGFYQPPQRDWTGYTTMTSPSPPPPRGMDVGVQHTETGRTYAYVAAYAAGLRVVDVTDPTAPVEVGALEFEPATAATGIVVAGQVAYLATQDGLRVVDVSNPTRPVEIAALPAVSWDVALAGDRLYLVEGQCNPLDGCMSGSLQVVGISDPASPARIGLTPLIYSQVMALAGENIYTGTRDGLVIFRQSDSSKPASYWPPTSTLLIRDIAVHGDYLYLAAGDNGLKILNVAEATAPTQVGEFPPPRRQPQNPHWRTYTAADGLLGASVTDILIDEAGRKWIATVGALNVFDGQTWQSYTSATGLADRRVSALARDAAGHIWVGYANPDNPVGMSMFDGQRWQHFSRASDVVAIAVDPNGPVWFAARSGLAQFDGKTWNFHRFPHKDNSITTVAIDPGGKVWAGATSGLFDGSDWKPYLPSKPFADGFLEDIAIDSATGQVWLVSRENGVSVLDGQSITTYTTADGLISNRVYAVAIDAAGRKWFGAEAGVSLFDGQTWASYTTADGLVSGSVRAIAIDPAGHIWFGTDNGVSEFIP